MISKRQSAFHQDRVDWTEPVHPSPSGYVWAALGVAVATILFRLGHGALDKGQAALLYLPVVIVCAVRLGFGPAVLAAAGSFICWNFFFLPPYGTWAVRDPKDWLSLIVFLAVSVVTARLASQARTQAQEAQSREQEALALQRAGEQISAEIEIDRILPALAQQLVTACQAQYCAVFRKSDDGTLTLAAAIPPGSELPQLSQAGREDRSVSVPLIADGQDWGVLTVGSRRDGRLFNPSQQRLIQALANHAAVALARQSLSDAAAQAQALRESDALKDTLLSLVSHELRTPLASIKASASGLLHNRDDWNEASLVEALQAIDIESDRLSSLVSKLLDLSRLEAGAWKPQWDWCDPIDILGTALARLSDTDGAHVRVIAPEELPLVRADFVQIAQVLTNLLENALKYSPRGSDTVVTLRAAGNDLRFDVADSGHGIPSDEAEAVFERFHRLERHRRSGVPGTGLGLAICRGIIAAHGGRIWQENAPSGGAVFSFTLPRAARFAPLTAAKEGVTNEELDQEADHDGRTRVGR